MPAPTIEYRTADKSAWGVGPWQDEPDKRQWTDEATGLACLIVRGPTGALCGYVGVTPDHPGYRKDYYISRYDELGDAASLTAVEAAINDLVAHGGLTYADTCGHGEDPANGICHIPGEGEPDTVWWFGFDCAHYGDKSPATSPGSLSAAGAYRDLAYVTEQVEALAGQLSRFPATPSANSPAEGRAGKDSA